MEAPALGGLAALAVLVVDHDLLQHVADREAVSAGVHHGRPPDRAGDPHGALQAAPAGAAAAHHGADHVGAALGRHDAALTDPSPRASSRVFTTSSSSPSSTTTRFEPPPSMRCGAASSPRIRKRPLQLARAVRGNAITAAGPAHAHGGVASEAARSRGTARRPRDSAPVIRGSIRRSPGPSLLLLSSSSPAVQTLPAPRVSTTSPRAPPPRADPSRPGGPPHRSRGDGRAPTRARARASARDAGE